MAKKITVASQKGGVGKTTTTVILSELLASIGYKVLVIDFDSQGNATKMLSGKSIYDFIGKTIMEAIAEHNIIPYIIQRDDNISFVPAEDNLSTFSRYIYTRNIANPTKILDKLLSPIDNEYDFVFVDVGPTLGDTMINTLTYVDNIIVPVDLGEFAMDAMVRFIEFLNTGKSSGYVKGDIIGILHTMKDGRSKHERDIAEAIRDNYGDIVFNTDIRRRTKIKEFSSYKIDTGNKTLIDYVGLLEELLTRLENRGE